MTHKNSAEGYVMHSRANARVTVNVDRWTDPYLTPCLTQAQQKRSNKQIKEWIPNDKMCERNKR